MFKKTMSMILGITMMISCFLPVSLVKVLALEEKNTQQTLTIPVTKTDGDSNKFTFAKGKWDGENETVHRWSYDLDKNNPQDTYYEVKFYGNKIDVYAGGNFPMGEVEYYIDGVSKGKHDLYNDVNIMERKITTFEGLSEDKEHIFKAVATGKAGKKGGNLIDAGKVVVYHSPYVITKFDIENNNLKLAEGASHKINITNITPNYATISDLSFESKNNSIASVDDNGVITAQSKGETKINISSKAGKLSKEISVVVEEGNPELSGSIVDIDRQYTQEKYDTVKGLNKTNEKLNAWKNDKALSEIVLVSKDLKLKDVTVVADNLVGSSGTINSSNIKITFIKSTKAYYGKFLGYGNPNNTYPIPTPENRKDSSDILYQDTSKGMDIPSKTVQPVWVEFNIPKDTVAGTYTTTLTVNAKGLKNPLKFNYTIEVQNAVLPNADTFSKTFDIELWQYPYSIAEYYGVEPFSEEHFKILKPHMELYKSIGGHAITTTISEDAWGGQTYSKNKNGVHYPSMIKWEKKNGKMTYDYTNFDKWVNFNKKLGMGDKIIIYSIAPWHNCFTYWENGELKKESYLTANNKYTDNYKTMWSDFLNDLIKHLEKNGWFEESYIGIDERGFSKEAFDLIDSVKGSTAKPLKTAGAMDHFVNKYELALRVSDLNVGDSAAASNPEQFTKLLKDREEKGYRTTLYSCTEHVPGNFSLSAPVESYWTVANAGKETSGFLRWAYDAWVENPLEDATHNAFEAGDCFLMYPGDKIEGQIPIPRSSVRLERMAQAVRDVNKLKLIAKEIPTLENDVNAVYNSFTFKARSVSGGYLLNEQEIQQIINDTTSFKKAIFDITNKYNDYKQNASKEVKDIQFENNIKEVALGDKVQLKVKITPEKVINNKVKWQSSNSKIASVNKNGELVAHKTGSVDITAISELNPDKKATLKIKVIVPEVAVNSRVAYYSFDKNDVKDQWGNRNGIDNGVSFVEGKSEKAVLVSPDKNIVFNESFDKNMTSWTTSYWVKATSPIQNRVSVFMDKEKDTSFDLKMAHDRSSGVHVGKADNMILTFDYPFKQNQWYHITWTQDKTNGLSMYVNGQKVGNTNNWTAKNAFKLPLDIIGGDGFTGYVDEVKVFNKVLNQSEIVANMITKGLNLLEKEKTLYIDDTYEIQTNLVSDKEDKTITFKSSNPKVAKVDKDGLVTALKKGTAVITVENKAGGYVDTVQINVVKQLTLQNTLKKYQLNEKYLKDIEKSPYKGEGQNRQYLGQPDMVRTKTGRLITVYPIGHGHGPLVMRVSDDNGETWTEKTDIPSSWAYSQETPTIYKLNMENGKERLMLITACPGWGQDKDGNKHGFNTSYSDDNGNTWTEYKHWYSKFNDGRENPVVVGMASLIQLKDKNGNYIPKWMGVYHEQGGFVNYKTYLTFDKNGEEQWSEPVPYLTQHRAIEQKYQMCEIGMFRSPDGKRILGLARSQSHNNLSTLIYSDDEGETWSRPMEMQGSLAGERHKVAYDPISNRLLITFREVKYDLNGNNVFDGKDDWRCGDWVAWVGTYEDLLEQNQGDYSIILSKDYSQNYYGGDTGYAGVVVLEDGTFILDSYGHWDEEFSKSWKDSNGQYNVKTDLSYIRQAKFKLGNIENENNLVNYDELNKYVEKVKDTKKDNYEEDEFKLFEKALYNAKQILDNKVSQQVEVDNAYNVLKTAYQNLKNKEPNKPINPDKPDNKPSNKPNNSNSQTNVNNHDNNVKPNSPQTSDEINLGFIAIIMVTFGGIAIISCIKKSKRKVNTK